MRWLVFLFISIVPIYGNAQDIQYARSVVDTLAAPGMHGRGYVNDGDKIAAAFIENEFKKFGLKSFGDSYRQEFTLSVNTFPGEAGVSFCCEKWEGPVTGKDVIVHSASAGIMDPSGHYPIEWFDKEIASDPKKLKKFRKKNFSKKFIIIDPRGVTDEQMKKAFQHIRSNPFKAKGIAEIVPKLTWSVSQKVLDYPYIEIAARYDSLVSLRKAKDITVYIENQFIPSYTTQNVIGYIPGTQYPDSFIVFSAHYDHLGRMGQDTYFPGANDNASGIAMMLNLAKHYSKPENRPKYSIAFMAFGAEEAGLVGSMHYVKNPLFPLKQIKFLINTDLAGTGDDGITVVNGTVYNTYFKQLVKLNAQNSYLKEVKARGKAANSDHYFFSEAGVPAFFIYTMGGIKAYHDIYDRAETLPLTEFEDYFKLLNDLIKYLTNDI